MRKLPSSEEFRALGSFAKRIGLYYVAPFVKRTLETQSFVPDVGAKTTGKQYTMHICASPHGSIGNPRAALPNCFERTGTCVEKNDVIRCLWEAPPFKEH